MEKIVQQQRWILSIIEPFKDCTLDCSSQLAPIVGVMMGILSPISERLRVVIIPW
jgi:hypothetical protein